MSNSQAFDRLHSAIQQWVWKQEWSELRDIQEQAIDLILQADTDVIISASTASGKTEAAFLPACSRLAQNRLPGVGILYISPLKALINDQYRRLESLCQAIDMFLTPWHGDISLSVKNRLKREPNGALLITPESLESLLLNSPGWCKQVFANLQYIIIDEFHAFLGTERGCQLQSLLHRVEFMLSRIVPRIALSATLGDMQQVARLLRPQTIFPYKIITSDTSHSDLMIQMRGYLSTLEESKNENAVSAMQNIIFDLYKLLRNNSNLIFANSRAKTEMIAANLYDLSEEHNVPNEFFPHHGSLSKELRESLEWRLQQNKLPTTAVCTMTLELGIDIGHVDSIAQVTAPHSVSSLRQRIGRSGRRDSPAVLRLFITEKELNSHSHMGDILRLESIQCMAMINLLLRKWYEPPDKQRYHFSTLVQQTMSVIGQYGGVRAEQLWALLCAGGPFKNIDQKLYTKLLRSLGEYDLIVQTHDGLLVLGKNGEGLIEHFTFYAAFNTPEEYRLQFNGKPLGTLPIINPLAEGQFIIFAAKRWEIVDIDPEKKVVFLVPATGGRPPTFDGQGQTIHDGIRQEMFRIYSSKQMPIYFNKMAQNFFNAAIESFHDFGLNKTTIVEQGNTLYLFPWLGDKTINTITMLLRGSGLKTDNFAGIVDIKHASVDELNKAIKNILATSRPSAYELASVIPDTIVEKYDHLLPKELRDLDYGSKFFDVDNAYNWLLQLNSKIGN